MRNCYDCKSSEWKKDKGVDGVATSIFDGCEKNLVAVDGECEGYEAMKKVYIEARITINVTDEEFSEMKEQSLNQRYGCFCDVDIPEELQERVTKKGRFDWKESYIVADSFFREV